MGWRKSSVTAAQESRGEGVSEEVAQWSAQGLGRTGAEVGVAAGVQVLVLILLADARLVLW